MKPKNSILIFFLNPKVKSVQNTRANHFWIVFFIILIFAPILSVHAQKTKKQLQKEKKENLRRIKEAQATLQKTAKKKTISIGQLNAYKFQINTQNSLILNYKDEIDLLESEINQDQQIIDALEKDVSNLMSEYAAMIYAAYKASKGQDKLTFLFSSKTFNQFFRRIHYLNQYTEARKKQVKQINIIQKMLATQINAVETKKKKQITLLNIKLHAKKKLEVLKSKEQFAITSLNSREKEIKKEIKKRNKSLSILNKLIDEIIKKEIREAASTKILSSNFAKNKTKLAWPVSGFISHKFGVYKDPVLKRVEHNNPGIEIQTKPNSIVKCVFNGKIAVVSVIQGFNKAVIINHGNYFSVYAKLKTVSVKKGQILKTGDTIGLVQTGKDGIAELHFEIWKSFSKLNPEKWLKPK